MRYWPKDGLGASIREGNRDVTLGGEVIELVGPHLLDDMGEARRVGHVAMVQDEATGPAGFAVKQMIDARGVEERRAPLDAVNDVTFAQQEFGEIAAVLSRDAGQKRHLVFLCRQRSLRVRNDFRQLRAAGSPPNRLSARRQTCAQDIPARNRSSKRPEAALPYCRKG